MSLFHFLHCTHSLFSSSDYNQNIITLENLFLHNTSDNAWIKYKDNIYSIQKNDDFLLNLFNQFYGKDTTDFIDKMNFKEKKIIINKLKNRFIGKIKN